MRIRGELETAVLLRDDHREEALLLEKLPDLRWQVGSDMGDVPVVEHAAELLARAIEERLFLRRKTRRLSAGELRPGGLAGKKLAIPPHGPRFQCLPLGVRHRGQQSAVSDQEWSRDPALAKGIDVQRQQPGEAEP